MNGQGRPSSAPAGAPSHKGEGWGRGVGDAAPYSEDGEEVKEVWD